MKFIILSALAFAFCAFSSANAQIINIQFEQYGPSYDGTGADPSDNGTTWNQVINTTSFPLVDQNGAAFGGTTFSVSFSGNGQIVGGGIPNNGNASDSASLFTGFVYLPKTTSASFSYSGLTDYAGDTFSLYVYGGDDGTVSDSGRSVTVSLTDDGGGSATPIGGNPSSFSNPGNYAVLTGTIGSDGMITGTATLPAGNMNEADLNALQLDLQPAPTPEPSTWALILASFSILVVIVRRRTASVL